MANKKKSKQEEPKTPIYGVLSITCAIVGWAAFGIVLEPIAIVLGFISAANEKEKGIAAVGIVLGSIGLIILLVAFANLPSGYWRW